MMMLVNTVLTLPHVRYAVARAYVDYIFVIIFSAKIYESYILSISLTYNLHVRTCAERSERGIHDWITSANLSVGLARRKKWVSYWCGKHFTSDMAHGDCKSFSECKVTKKNIALQTKSRKTYCFSVTVFRKLKKAIIAMIFCSGSLTHFVTGIVSHFCNSYMLHLCWNHKFRGFQKVSEGFKRWRWFQIVSEGFRWFQMVSRGKNKTLKTKTTFLKTIAMSMSKGSGWKPALSVTGDEVSG